jgi:hypothetical protein
MSGFAIANANGLFGEIIIYNRILTSGKISTVYNYLKQKWDL